MKTLFTMVVLIPLLAPDSIICFCIYFIGYYIFVRVFFPVDHKNRWLSTVLGRKYQEQRTKLSLLRPINIAILLHSKKSGTLISVLKFNISLSFILTLYTRENRKVTTLTSHTSSPLYLVIISIINVRAMSFCLYTLRKYWGRWSF